MDSYSEEHLNAFVDRQLTLEERDELLSAAAQDPMLRQRITDLGDVKSLVRKAYRDVPSGRAKTPQPSIHSGTWLVTQWRSAVAACLLVCTGALIGWGADDVLGKFSSEGVAQRIFADGTFTPLRIGDTGQNNVILDLSADTPEQVEAGLEETERLLRRFRAEQVDTQIEVVARSDGLNLLRADASSYRARVLRMIREYDNLRFIACEKAIEQLERERGMAVELLPGVGRASAGLERVIDHLQDGWWYIRI